MRLSVVTCPCGNPKAHRKLQTGDGELESRGFFSIEDGKLILARTLKSGRFEQTPEETAATTQEIESCGLPTTEAEIETADEPAETSEWPEERLQFLADALKGLFPQEQHQMVIHLGVEVGMIPADEGEKIIAMATKIEQ